MRPHSFNISGDGAQVVEDGLPTEHYTWVIFWILLATVWTTFMVSLPVATEIGPNDYYAHHHGWYTGNDVVRFLEPIGGLLLNCIVLYKSKILTAELTNQQSVAMIIFVFGCALYVQGGAFHSASNMFKNSLEDVQADYDDDRYHALHYYMRTVWEHGVSHYIYAVGLVIMHAIQAWSYRELRAPEQGLSLKAKVLLGCSSCVLAFLVFVVATQFPSGTIVGFIYLLLYGFGVLGGYLVTLYRNGERRALTQFGFLPVLHHFIIAYFLGFVILVLWIIAAGGFVQRQA